MIKITAALLALVLIAVSFAGCSDSDDKLDLIYPFSGNINSFDPQVASTQDEFLIAENCFEGLVRCDDEGNITPGCAKSWSVSNDGKTYTFELYQGLKWHIYDSVKKKMGEDYGPEITADDFVFALQRAADDTTQSPLYSTISSIANAPEVHSGSADESTLGVTASGKYSLTINLSSPDDSFLETMSTAVAMPCNREFFESTGGRYGLKLEYTLFNGQFYIKTILDTSYILAANKDYSGPTKPKATDLTLNIVDDDTDLSKDLLSGYYDAAYIRGYESSEISDSSGVSLTPYSNITWMFVINGNDGIFAEKDARKALYLSIADIDYDEYSYLQKASGYVPPTCTANGVQYNTSVSGVAESADAEKAAELWKEVISEEEIYTTEITLLVPDYMEEVARELAQGIQAGIGSVSSVNDKDVSFSMVIEALPESEMKSRVAASDYDIALYPYTASSTSPLAFLQTFENVSYAYINSSGYSEALADAASADASGLAQACYECEKELYKNYSFLPVFYESCYYAQAKGVSGVQFHPGSGRVSFIYATRK